MMMMMMMMRLRRDGDAVCCGLDAGVVHLLKFNCSRVSSSCLPRLHICQASKPPARNCQLSFAIQEKTIHCLCHCLCLCHCHCPSTAFNIKMPYGSYILPEPFVLDGILTDMQFKTRQLLRPVVQGGRLPQSSPSTVPFQECPHWTRLGRFRMHCLYVYNEQLLDVNKFCVCKLRMNTG